MKVSTREKAALVLRAIRERYQFVYVRAMQSYYYKETTERLYEPVTERRFDTIVRDEYVPRFGLFMGAELDNIKKVLKASVEEELDELDRSIVMIDDYSYWDAVEGRVVREANRPCFYRLFNTKVGTKHVPIVAPFTKEQDQTMWQVYQDTACWLEKGNELRVEYDFVEVWANGVPDLYRDMMRAIAFCFVNKKPLGSYVLVGQARGGKSTYTGLLHTIFGACNTSSVQLTQLGDPHHTHTLLTTLMNAPDEEDDKAVDQQAFFKSMADHGAISLPVMRSNVPVQLNCDFMSFFPMNHTPEWRGTGATACLRRTLVLPFYADLSDKDRSSDSFEEDTFTAETLCKFMGTVFALASYYTSHPFDFGSTMQQEQEILTNEVNSCILYKKQWQKYYDGFSSDKVLYNDYVAWCIANDLKMATLKELKFCFREYKANRRRKRVGDKVIWCCQIPKPSHHQMIPEDYMPEFKKTAEEMWASELSCVACIVDYYEEKGISLE